MATSRKHKKDMIAGSVFTSERFGELVIVEYISALKIKVRFTETGYERFAAAGCIRNGSVRDPFKPTYYGVGYLGVGPHKPTSNKIRSKAYGSWTNMLKRCYSDVSLLVDKSYIGCTVCREWHDYQNFAEWFEKESKGMVGDFCVDKDIKIKGNKTYSPDTCMIVSISDNSQHSVGCYKREWSLISPIGEVVTFTNQSRFADDNLLCKNGVSLLIRGKLKSHKGWTRV